MTELRRTPRAPIDATVQINVKGDGETHTGHARDISLGGMFIEIALAPKFGSDCTVTLTMPGQKAPFIMPGIVRWTRDGGMGVQFGLLGARETHSIIEFVKASGLL